MLQRGRLLRLGRDVNLALAITGVTAGLVGGVLVGWRLGVANRASRRAYWMLNTAVVFGCGLLNFAGLVTARSWLAYAAIGLMGGLITGMKYGYSESGGVWHRQDPATEGDDTVRYQEAPPDEEAV